MTAVDERIARVACVEMGCSVMISGFSMSGAAARQSLVAGSLSRCIDIGQRIAEAREAKTDPVAAVVELLGGRELFGAFRHVVTTAEEGATVCFAVNGSSSVVHADTPPNPNVVDRTVDA